MRHAAVLASAAQQLGITLDPSTAKAGFLTAMYVVLVPVFGLFLGRKGSAQLWVSMAIAVVGLYLLCMKDGFGSIQSSDGLLLLCAVLFSFQIMAVDHFSPQMDGVRLSLVEFLWCRWKAPWRRFCSSSLPWQSLSPSPGPSCTAA